MMQIHVQLSGINETMYDILKKRKNFGIRAVKENYMKTAFYNLKKILLLNIQRLWY